MRKCQAGYREDWRDATAQRGSQGGVVSHGHAAYCHKLTTSSRQFLIRIQPGADSEARHRVRRVLGGKDGGHASAATTPRRGNAQQLRGMPAGIRVLRYRRLQ